MFWKTATSEFVVNTILTDVWRIKTSKLPPEAFQDTNISGYGDGILVCLRWVPRIKFKSSWWWFQPNPSEKIMRSRKSSNWIMKPQGLEWRFQKYLSCHHLKICYMKCRKQSCISLPIQNSRGVAKRDPSAHSLEQPGWREVNSKSMDPRVA